MEKAIFSLSVVFLIPLQSLLQLCLKQTESKEYTDLSYCIGIIWENIKKTDFPRKKKFYRDFYKFQYAYKIPSKYMLINHINNKYNQFVTSQEA